MKHLAFGAGVLSLVAAVTVAAFVTTTGEVPLTGLRFRGDVLRGPGAYALALGVLFGGAVAFFASCMSMWPQRRAFFRHLRTVSLVVAGGAMVIAVIGGYMARGGISAI